MIIKSDYLKLKVSEDNYQVNLPPEASFSFRGFLSAAGDLIKPNQIKERVEVSWFSLQQILILISIPSCWAQLPYCGLNSLPCRADPQPD